MLKLLIDRIFVLIPVQKIKINGARGNYLMDNILREHNHIITTLFRYYTKRSYILICLQ